MLKKLLQGLLAQLLIIRKVIWLSSGFVAHNYTLVFKDLKKEIFQQISFDALFLKTTILKGRYR